LGEQKQRFQKQKLQGAETITNEESEEQKNGPVKR